MQREEVNLGLIGETLKHSLSPEISRYLLKQQGLNGTYRLYEISAEHIPDVIQKMRQEKIKGLNVTIPYKETVIPYLDEVCEAAHEIGAVNTIYLKDGRTYGYNTDYIGVQYMFRKHHTKLEGKKTVVLGAGGAAKAVIYALYKEKAEKITVAARNKEKAEKLRERFPYISICSFQDIEAGDILVNTTPVGMYPETGVSPVNAPVIKRFKIAADIVYNPLVTEFLRIAGKEGLTSVTGLSMLAGQAIAAHEIWMETSLDYEMGAGICEKLAERF